MVITGGLIIQYKNNADSSLNSLIAVNRIISCMECIVGNEGKELNILFLKLLVCMWDTILGTS